MPGYEKERFITLSNAEKTELMCSICQGIFNSPLVTNCCLQTFCEQCIKEWLKTNNSCPYDRKVLRVEDLRGAPRVLTNLLGKLQITCDYKDKGCDEVLNLDQLAKHITDCPFNSKICNKCFCFCKVSHDCVKELLVLNKRENELIESLRHEKDIFAKITDDLRERFTQENQTLVKEKQEFIKNFAIIKQNFEKEIKTLKTENEKLIKSFDKKLIPNSRPLYRPSSTQSLFEGRPTIHDMLTEARKHLSQRVTVTESNISAEICQTVVSIVKNEIRSNNNMYYICQNIVYKLDHELGSSWCVITNYDKHGHNYTNSCCFVKLKFGKLTFKIYKTKFLDVPLMRRRVREGKVKEEIKIFDTDMTEEMIKFVKSITFNALKKCNSLKAIATEIRNKMENQFEGNWICFAHHFGDYCIHKRDKTFISYDIEDLKLTLFQLK